MIVVHQTLAHANSIKVQLKDKVKQIKQLHLQRNKANKQLIKLTIIHIIIQTLASMELKKRNKKVLAHQHQFQCTIHSLLRMLMRVSIITITQ
jgi:hypothetical protein